MPNAFETEKIKGEIAHLKGCMRAGLYRDKQTREQLLQELRHKCHALGLHVPSYNSPEFSEWLRK